MGWRWSVIADLEGTADGGDGRQCDWVLDLSECERDLVQAARGGLPLVCGDLKIEDLAETSDLRYLVRAELIRELLLGSHGELDPRGIQLSHARIVGRLDLELVDTQARLDLRSCVVDEPIQLDTARLRRLDLSGSRIESLHADGLQVDGVLSLMDGFHAIGGGSEGSVRLIGARIGGSLAMTDARLANRSGPALIADGLRVDGVVFLGGLRAAAVSGDGTVLLLGAHIRGNLEMDGGQLINESGPALIADGLTVEGAVFLSGGFRAVGAGDMAAVRLRAANMRLLDLADAVVEHAAGFVVDLNGATIGLAKLSATLVCPAGAADTAACPHASRRIDIDNFAYGALDRSSWRQWLHLIACHTSAYRPGPYQRLAAVERAAGHDDNARHVLISQQQDLRARGNIGGPLTRLIHRAWGLLAGYGYRARRIVLALLLAFTLAATLGCWAGHWVTTPGHHAAEHTTTSGSPPGTPCSTIEQIGLGIDRGLPFAPAGLRERCDLNTTTTAGQLFTAAIWLLQALVGGLATLAIAGYTNLIRKPT